MARQIIITGAAGGIGTALVTAFANVGDHIVAVDRTPGMIRDNVDWVISDIALLSAGDDSADSLVERIKFAANGSCDVLINNAATQHVGDFVELTAAMWIETLAVNLLAPVVLTREMLPLMPAAGGVVINVSSIHAHLTKPGFTAYATSKAALSGLTRALAVELGHRARFVAIEPAAIGTPMLHAGFQDNPEGFALLEAMHPAGRIGRPEEIAHLALMLASPGMDFINGTSVSIDGGIAARLHDPA